MSRLKKGGLAAGVFGLGSLTTLAVSTIGGQEGLRTKAYRDSVGVATICFGETRGVRMGMQKSRAECEAMFRDRLDEFGNRLEACVPDAKDPARMGPHAYTALLSLSYNIGSGGFCRSSVARLWNAGDHRGACEAMLRFNRAGGRVLAGLTRRRKAERAMCLKDI